MKDAEPIGTHSKLADNAPAALISGSGLPACNAAAGPSMRTGIRQIEIRTAMDKVSRSIPGPRGGLSAGCVRTALREQ